MEVMAGGAASLADTNRGFGRSWGLAPRAVSSQVGRLFTMCQWVQ